MKNRLYAGKQLISCKGFVNRRGYSHRHGANSAGKNPYSHRDGGNRKKNPYLHHHGVCLQAPWWLHSLAVVSRARKVRIQRMVEILRAYSRRHCTVLMKQCESLVIFGL
jgi:hypothetical protein